MQTPQTIAILGMGATGSRIARCLSGTQDLVLLIDKEFSKAQALATELHSTDPTATFEEIACSYTGAWEADIILLDVPPEELAEVADRIREVANQKVLVSTLAAASELLQFFPNSKHVQAFEGIRSGDFELPFAQRQFIRCPLTSGSQEALDSTATLIRKIGFEPVVYLQQV